MDFEILKTGKFTNSNGKEVNFSQEDLNQIASSYNPKVSEAPIVIGHPKSNDPAYGWIDSLKVEGEKLIASASKIVPEFLDAVKQGLFKKRSVSLNPDNSLRHVGFLGAALPAVKGLADLQFSELPEENLIEFSDCQLPSVIPSTEKENDDEEFRLPDILLQITNLSEEVNKLTNEFYEWKELRINLDRSENNSEPALGVVYTFSSNFKDQVEQAFSDGKLTVPMKEKLLSLLTMDFSENANEKFSLENFLSSFISSFPVFISNSDFATPPEKQESEVPKPFDFSEFILDEDAAQVHKKIVEVVMDKKISYQDAAQIVFNS